MENIARQVRQFLVENFLFGRTDDQFSDDESFLESGLVDSMGILTLVTFVQETFPIAIEDDEIVPENWDSVRRIAAFVASKLGKDQVVCLPSARADERRQGL